MMEAGSDFFHYKNFKAIVPEQVVFTGPQGYKWRYYDFGPKNVNPIVCLGGIASTADVFYKQILSLSRFGYRIIAIDFPPFLSFQKWCSGFDHFLDSLNIFQIHLYGTSLGGFLSQLFCLYRPRRVLSLLLSNSFLDTSYFHSLHGKWRNVFHALPNVFLRRKFISLLPYGPHEAQITDSIGFVLSCMKHLTSKHLSSRLYLYTEPKAIGPLPLPDSQVTIMDCLDYVSEPLVLRDVLYVRYPEARRAFLKTGADFPFLSRASEVTLHIILHLRHVGVESPFHALLKEVSFTPSSAADFDDFDDSSALSLSSDTCPSKDALALPSCELIDSLHSSSNKLGKGGSGGVKVGKDDVEEGMRNPSCLVKTTKSKKFCKNDEILDEESDKEDSEKDLGRRKRGYKESFEEKLSSCKTVNHGSFLVSLWSKVYFSLLRRKQQDEGQALFDLKKSRKVFDNAVDFNEADDGEMNDMD